MSIREPKWWRTYPMYVHLKRREIKYVQKWITRVEGVY